MQDEDLPRRKSASLAERVAGRMTSGGLGPAGLGRAAAPPAAAPAPVARPAVIPPPPPANPAPGAATTRAAAPAPIVSPPPQQPAAMAPSQPAPQPPPAAPLLAIDFVKLRANGIVTPDSPRSGSTEEFRVIKRQILKSSFTENRTRSAKNSNVIMVTSSIPGEGKTYTALNLAMSFSMERDLHLLLVDADNHRHSLSSLLGADQPRIGLLDVLVDHSVQLRDVILRTNVPSLSVIPAGRPHPQGSELMSSRQMAELMEELAQRYPDRLIIIDTPPLLASTEGVVLSSLVGHAIVVVEKDRTPKRSLRRSLDMLEGCRNISCVLNMDTSDKNFSSYAYGY